MAFQVSPGVNVSEVDLTTVVPAVSTTEGAIAGVFNWGPAEERVLVDSETSLVSRFGEPTSDNFETFFTASNFLNYGNKLFVVRTVSSAALNATGALSGGNTTGMLIKNDTEFEAGVSQVHADHIWAAKYPGVRGNGLRVEVCDSTDAWSSNVDVSHGGGSSAHASINATGTGLFFTVGNANATLKIVGSGAGITNTALTVLADAVVADLNVGDLIQVGNSSIGEQKISIKSFAANSSDTFAVDGGVATLSRTVTFDSRFTLGSDFDNKLIQRFWKYFNSFDNAPGTSSFVEEKGGAGDELHIVVIDEDGDITGTKNTILETYPAVSRATDAKNESGETIFFKTKIDDGSSWAYSIAHPGGASYSNTAANMTALSTALPRRYLFNGGADGNNEGAISLGDLSKGYDLFKDSSDVDVSLMMVGKAVGGSNGEALLNYIIDNICEVRKDCVVFGSPDRADVVGVTNASTAADNIVAFRNSARSSSYGILDSGYKYQYDKYSDVYRYVPLNGDMAGLSARTDVERDAWFSPGGFNRGQIKNVVKLAFNPQLAFRDLLYKNGINPVVSFPGQGTILFGDKTLLNKPSAFDRINVRRLFIVLEKAISTAAKFSLFEYNDEFTRAQFVNLVEPFLRDVQGRRGIFDFRVVCDSSNNTGEVIDRNEFVGDIYVKPARSINFIQLNFVAVRSGVEFSEVVGKF
jgi:hypothetical protein|tara:strand:- start:16715 stop:18799 length:2085 start_codon:yes stop_codon:yes gene_type:complete